MEFGHLLVLVGFAGIIVGLVIFIIAYKIGIDVTSTRFVVKLIVVTCGIFILIPFWLTDLSIADKIVGTVIASVAGLGYFLLLYNLKLKKMHKK